MIAAGPDPATSGRTRAKADRRELLLATAARLFAERGYRAVSLEELGGAAGVTGPAVYRHFTGKQQVLAHLLVGVSRHLLAGGRDTVAAAGSDVDALTGLVSFHTAFALADADLIRIQDRDLSSLSPSDARLVRRLQRAYLEVWAEVIQRLHPGLAAPAARIMAQAAFGLINSTSHSGDQRDTEGTRRILETMALAALLAPRRKPG